MKALSLTQPWASLIVNRHKHIETRDWRTNFVGRIAIHASKANTASDRDYAGELFKQGLVEPVTHMPHGAIIGTAYVMGCRVTTDIVSQIGAREQSFGDYGPNRFAWFLTDAYRLEQPIPCKGALGLWTVPPDIVTQLEADARRWLRTADADFHVHLNGCAQCEQHPFNLCTVGAALLQKTAGFAKEIVEANHAD